MTSAAPADLSASLIIPRIEGGEYPREAVLTIARGFLPLEQADLIAVLAYLIASGDAEAAELARGSLGDIPSRIVLGVAAGDSAPPEHLAMLTRATDDPVILEALIQNRSVDDQVIAELAARASAEVQEVIVINQRRILRAPEILDALLANPKLTPDARRRALEVREEFFDKKARQQPQEAEVDDDDLDLSLPDEPIIDLLEKALTEEAKPALVPLEPTEAEKTDPKRMSVFAEVLTMSVSQKVQLAFKGGKTARMILIRDRNRLVCSAVMRNPRMNDSEVESIAGMRNVDDEVLRLITTRREWMAKYNIVLTLIRNAKAPIGVVLPLINRLTLRDLKGLKDDKNVSEAVRVHARKLFVQRSQKS
jgi:hypothetical protein